MLKTQPGGQQRSRRKRFLFLSIIAVAVYAFAELTAFVGLHLSGAVYYHEDLQGLANGAEADGSSEAIHPYLGWVHNPQVALPEQIFDKTIPVNQLGFKDDGPTIHRRSPDRFIVGILGGSVAWHTSVAGSEIIKERLKAHPAIKGRKVEIVRLAASGYKQPQQVMALNYVQVMGGEFDAVVNIDGYNEVALALVENGYGGTAIVYPRSWATRTISALNPESYAAAARLLHLRGSRQQGARDFLQSNFRWSPLRTLMWLAIDRSRQRGIVELGMEVSNKRKGGFVNHGPVDQNTPETELDAAVIDIWKRSSVQLQHACEATNTIYLHVLQPNQYMTDSKAMSAYELENAYREEQVLGKAIARLYPRLLNEAPWLQTAGVAFSDQTMLFADETDTIYSDPFCHYNQRGNEMLAEAVARELTLLIPETNPQP